MQGLDIITILPFTRAINNFKKILVCYILPKDRTCLQKSFKEQDKVSRGD